MKDYQAKNIRNLTIIGHGGVGKTTLAEALLFTAGAIDRQGRVEDGSTVSDLRCDQSHLPGHGQSNPPRSTPSTMTITLLGKLFPLAYSSVALYSPSFATSTV